MQYAHTHTPVGDIDEEYTFLLFLSPHFHCYRLSGSDPYRVRELAGGMIE